MTYLLSFSRTRRSSSRQSSMSGDAWRTQSVCLPLSVDGVAVLRKAQDLSLSRYWKRSCSMMNKLWGRSPSSFQALSAFFVSVTTLCLARCVPIHMLGVRLLPGMCNNIIYASCTNNSFVLIRHALTSGSGWMTLHISKTMLPWCTTSCIDEKASAGATIVVLWLEKELASHQNSQLSLYS